MKNFKDLKLQDTIYFMKNELDKPIEAKVVRLTMDEIEIEWEELQLLPDRMIIPVPYKDRYATGLISVAYSFYTESLTGGKPRGDKFIIIQEPWMRTPFPKETRDSFSEPVFDWDNMFGSLKGKFPTPEQLFYKTEQPTDQPTDQVITDEMEKEIRDELKNARAEQSGSDTTQFKGKQYREILEDLTQIEKDLNEQFSSKARLSGGRIYIDVYSDVLKQKQIINLVNAHLYGEYKGRMRNLKRKRAELLKTLSKFKTSDLP